MTYIVDWAATGQMISGIGTVCGAAAVAYAAYKGAGTFDQWKSQKKEERRMSLAEDVLTIGYEFERIFSAIRSPATWAFEAEASLETLRQQFSDFDQKSEFQRRVLSQAQVILTRFASHKDFWDRFFAVFPSARAYFGQPALDLLTDLWACATSVRAAAQTYGGYIYPPTDDFISKLEHRFWEGAGDTDTLKEQVLGNIKKLDEMLLPALRH